MSLDDPRRPYPPRPMLDDDSADVLDQAVAALVALRAPMHFGDAGADLHAIVSLIAEARDRLPRTVADARDQQHTWTEIARQLRRQPAPCARSLRRPHRPKEDAPRAWLIPQFGAGGRRPARAAAPTDYRHIPELLDAITGITEIPERLPIGERRSAMLDR